MNKTKKCVVIVPGTNNKYILTSLNTCSSYTMCANCKRLYQRQFGSVFTSVPFAGVHVFSSRNLWVSLFLGYLFPGKHLEELRGIRAKVGVDFSLW